MVNSVKEEMQRQSDIVVGEVVIQVEEEPMNKVLQNRPEEVSYQETQDCLPIGLEWDSTHQRKRKRRLVQRERKRTRELEEGAEE